MPKKNAFFFFMTKRKAEMEASGVILTRGLAEVAPLVDHEWQALSEVEKGVFKEIANAFNENLRIQQGKPAEPQPTIPNPAKSGKKNSRGEDVMDLYNKYQEKQMEEEEMRRIFVTITSLHNAVSAPIILINFSFYEDSPDLFLPAEVALCVFNVEEGIFDNYSSLIDPRVNSTNIQKKAKKLAVPEPDYDPRLQDYATVVRNLHNFIEIHSKELYGESYLFCLDKDIKQVTAGLEWLFENAKRSTSYKLLSLDLYIQHISCIAYSDRLRADVVSSLTKFHITSPKRCAASLQRAPQMTTKTASHLNAKYRKSCEKYFYDSEDDSDEEMEKKKKKEMKPQPPKDWTKDPALLAMAAVTKGYVTKPGLYPFISKGVFFHPVHVNLFLQADNYAYHEELACLYHMERRDGVSHCPMNIVNRQAYSLLDVLILIFAISPIPGSHYPTINEPTKESRRRCRMLERWTTFDYRKLASQEKAKDVDLMECDV